MPDHHHLPQKDDEGLLFPPAFSPIIFVDRATQFHTQIQMPNEMRKQNLNDDRSKSS